MTVYGVQAKCWRGIKSQRDPHYISAVHGSWNINGGYTSIIFQYSYNTDIGKRWNIDGMSVNKVSMAVSFN
jgi:hypothetical protein